MVLIASVVLAVASGLVRSGRHPRLLQGAIAYGLTSYLVFAFIVASPHTTVPLAVAYGIPLAAAGAAALVPWARLLPLIPVVRKTRP
jgi:hypothetical protein